MDEPIADGGMGEVWRATDVSLARTVAVKVVRPALLKDPDFDARFRAEARMMAALTHPNVVNVYDYGRSALDTGSSVTYLVMAYVDGEPLSRRIADAGRLPVAETMSVVAQAADALHAAHRSGIVHRDVKPANLLVQPNGAVKLVDFGVARSPAITQITTANAVLGTATYMAPEQATGRPVSPATDIYALGAVAYHCLAGRPPFSGGAPLEIAIQHVSDEPPPLPGDLPPAVLDLVTRALAKNPADRYPTAAAFAAAARAIMPGQGMVRHVVAMPGAGPLGAGRRPSTAPDATRDVLLGAPGEPTMEVRSTAPDPPTRADLPLLVDQPLRKQHSGPRLGAVVGVAGVAAAVLLGLAGLGGLLGPARSGGGPAGSAERTGAPIAPVANPSSAAPEPSDQNVVRGTVPVGVNSPASVPPAAPAPTADSGAGDGSGSGEPTATAEPTATTEPTSTGTPSTGPTARPSAPAPTIAPTTPADAPSTVASSAPAGG